MVFAPKLFGCVCQLAFDSTEPVRLEINEGFTAEVVLVAQALDVVGLHGVRAQSAWTARRSARSAVRAMTELGHRRPRSVAELDV